MRDDPLFLVWNIRCTSPQEADRVRQRLREESAPEAVIIDSVFAAGDTSEVPYRVGDFFQGLELLPGPDGDPCALRVVFQRSPTSGRFWKDMMIRLLRSAQQAGNNPVISLAYRGDRPPGPAVIGSSIQPPPSTRVPS
jgi:hypothetical protein